MTKKLIPTLLIVMSVLFAYSILTNIRFAHADSTNLPATVATTSNPTVNTTASLVFATSSCVARVISTTASPIMMTFTDAQGKVPTATFGVLQPASTTVSYDASQYGCGAVRIYSFVSGAITVQEAR